MKKRTKILFPTDYSEPAANAFRYALLLADSLDADILLLHVIFPDAEPLDIPVMAVKATQARVEAGTYAMKAFTEMVLTQLNGQLKNAPSINSDIEIGTPIQTIVEIARRDDIDLIVMGTKGERKGLGKLLGSVASGVVSRAGCPVMVVPEEVPFKKPVNVAYATDITDADPFEIWKMTQLLSPFNAIVHCVHFNMKGEMSDDHEKMEQMEQFFAGRTPAVQMKFYHLPGKKLERDINEFIDNHNMDMLVMYQPKRNFLERLFHRSNVKRLALTSHVPLLVQKEG